MRAVYFWPRITMRESGTTKASIEFTRSSPVSRPVSSWLSSTPCEKRMSFCSLESMVTAAIEGMFSNMLSSHFFLPLLVFTVAVDRASSMLFCFWPSLSKLTM